MKQKILNSFRLRVVVLVAILCSAFAGTAWGADETITVDFETGSMPSGWTNSNFEIVSTPAQGSYAASTGGKTTATLTYNAKITKVKSVSVQTNRTSNNTNTSLYIDFSTNSDFSNSTSQQCSITKNSWTDNTLTLTTATDGYVRIRWAGTTAVKFIDNIVITYEEESGSSAVATTTTINATGITNTDVYTGTAAGSLSASVTAGGNTLSNATVTWSGNNDAVATINTSTGAVTLVGEGTVTFTANYAGVENQYQASSATHQMTVTNSDPNKPGSANNPYTVAQAIANTPSSGNVYISGKVSAFYNTSIVGDGNNYRYYISDDGTATTQLLVYKGKGLNENTFTNANDLLVGDEVVIYGSLITYQNAPEVASGNYLYSWNRPAATTPTITISNNSLSGFTYEEGNGPSSVKSFTVSGEHLTANISLNLGESNFEISLIENGTYASSLTLTQSNGTVSETTVYVRLKADLSAGSYNGTISLASTDATSQSVSLSGSVTAPVVQTCATLPFSFDGGRGDIEDTDGLYQYELGSDYNSSPKLKLDSEGDYVLLQFSERPGTLTFNVKGNPGGNPAAWVGTFKVQTSSDGNTWTDLASYDGLTSTVQNENFDNLDANIRYIKWIYSSKTQGNVALGNIELKKYVAPVPSITVNPATANPAASDVEGTLALTYQNLTISYMDDFDVVFCDSEGNALGQGNEPDWIMAGVAEEQGGGYVVSYIMDENTGAARTAYFKVFAIDGNDYVYSNLVTVTQAAYVAPPAPGNWVLTNLADLTSSDIFVIVGTLNNATYALPNDGGTSAPSIATVTVANNTLSGEIAANLQWNLSGNATDGYTFYPNGDNENWLYCSTTAASSSNNNIKVGTGDRKVFMQDDDDYLVTKDNYVGRYLSIYVNSGTAQDWRGYNNTNSAPTISFYKKVSTVTINVSQYKFATAYYSDKALKVPATGVTAHTFKVGQSGKLERSKDYEANAVIPAGEAVVLYAPDATGTEYSFQVTTTNEECDANSVLKGSDEAATTTGGTYYYMLSLNSNSDANSIGFYYGATGGAAFTNGAHKAYVAVANQLVFNGTGVGGARLLSLFEEDNTTTGISNVNVNENDNCYDLQGRRIAQPSKGMYIVNGKKVIIK